MPLTNKLLHELFSNFATTMQINAAYLSKLDTAIGDGDHGSNMMLGFQNILQQVELLPARPLGLLLRTAGMTLTTTVSGVSGPLYGAAFIAAGMAAPSSSEAVKLADLARMVQAAEEAVARRGHCRPGDKTIFDALQPASQTLTKAVEHNLDLLTGLAAAVEAARLGMQATVPLVARRGLAMQYGPSSRGHQDPGATSCYLLFESLWQTLRQHCA